MLQVGDTVVVMSAPGMFEILAIDGDHLTIQNANGVRKVVLAQAARRIDPAAPGAS